MKVNEYEIHAPVKVQDILDLGDAFEKHGLLKVVNVPLQGFVVKYTYNRGKQAVGQIGEWGHHKHIRWRL